MDNCDYVHTGTAGDAYLMSYQTATTNQGIGLAGIYFWNVNITKGTTAKHAIFAGPDKWLSVVGGTIAGGSGNLSLDHHIYSDVKSNQIYRYIKFEFGRLNTCFNVNANSSAGEDAYFLCDGCDITGTQNGFDFSNSNNNNLTNSSSRANSMPIAFVKIASGESVNK